MKSYVISLRNQTDRWAAFANHFSTHRLWPDRFYGIDAVQWGLTTKHPYEVDHPGTGFHMPQKHVGLHLSHYILWRQFSASHDGDVCLVLEDDARYNGSDLAEDLDKYGKWVEEKTPDEDGGFDHPIMLLLGSCNCGMKEQTEVDTTLGIFDVRWPQCTHAYIINKAAANLLIVTQEKSWAPIDLALIFNSYPKFAKEHGGVYTVLPRLFDQEGTVISQ